MVRHGKVIRKGFAVGQFMYGKRSIGFGGVTASYIVRPKSFFMLTKAQKDTLQEEAGYAMRKRLKDFGIQAA